MAPGRRFDDDRRAQVHAAMSRELVQLRQLVRQFVDYTRLKTDRALVLGAGPATVATVMDELAATLAVSARVRVRVQDDLAVRADPDRLHQMVLALASALLRDAPAETELEITATAGEGTAEISVSAPVPGPIPGFEESGAAGIGLHVTCELALAQGGNVRAEASGYVLTLPLAG
jgi:signal transduction histidine kinase